MSFKNANEYFKGNNFIEDLTHHLLDKFCDWIEWRKDGKDSILDIGSGPGNSFHSTMFCRLPSNFSRLVLSDISKPMVELQKKEFEGVNKVSCEVLDIGSPIDENLLQKLGTFDHVTSFYCLMWVKDQQQAMDNIYKLLKPGGNCFLLIVADCPIFDAVLSVCEKPRWKDYFKGWQDFYVYPYKKVDEAKAKGLSFMEKAGFVDIKAEIVYYPWKFRSDKEKEYFLRAMPNKFSKNVTAEEEEEIFQERLQFFDKFNLGQYRDNTGKIDKPNSYLILYGKKRE
ncbi:juvenile hormone acid O-methyltransferase-like [Phlebotomus argentipes]|uniref:juvenile hormone acid O-methyltransferase-like n=1 Tax=Phlebotomus argentipes TaxID=94469 RepID=UPI002893037C|nr:juvenile hormone acid O-methyltransferase-like [Phlebotomus argentipes]